ncbi:MAG TPA: BON domain-containing protein [Caldimonas sp.]|jgi:hyperosmotically inducible protein|nr:BON domain-containing protein [Caldimonas sp.]HEX2539463.1 BON domain-containing protein [Caldimonas sp.]
MRPSPLRRLCLLGTVALAAALSACEKTTVTTQTPTGTSTTTRVGPSASAAEGMARAGDVLADTAMTAKVKAALIADGEVEAMRIDVDSRDGAVKLSGTQPTQAGIDRALSITKGIDGVKSVDSQLRVDASAPSASEPGGVTTAVTQGASEVAARAGEAIANGALTAKVKAALLADPDVKGLQIDVDSRDGVVTLSGTLDSAANVARAQAIARGTDGVKSVENRLAVKPGGAGASRSP